METQPQGVGPEPRVRTAWDGVADELQALRDRAGLPSYSVLAQLVAERRMATGTAPAAARVAKSTVHDYFRHGRTRGSLPLARELVAVLGGDPADVDTWLTRGSTAPPDPRPEEPEEAPEPVGESPAPARAPGVSAALLLLVGCVALNLLGRQFEEALGLPIYLDMIGTAIAALALGPWRGAATGLATNLLGTVVSGPASLPFALVNVAGALVWGYGVRRFGMGRSLPRFFVLNLIVAITCTLVAVPILAEVFGGSTGHAEDGITARLSDLGHTALLALGVSNLIVSVADKVISGFVALVAVAALPLAWRRTVPLDLLDGTGADTRDT